MQPVSLRTPQPSPNLPGVAPELDPVAPAPAATAAGSPEVPPQESFVRYAASTLPAPLVSSLVVASERHQIAAASSLLVVLGEQRETPSEGQLTLAGPAWDAALAGRQVTSLKAGVPFQRTDNATIQFVAAEAGGLVLKVADVQAGGRLWTEIPATLVATLSDGATVLVEVTAPSIEVDDTALTRANISDSLASLQIVQNYMKQQLASAQAYLADPSPANELALFGTGGVGSEAKWREAQDVSAQAQLTASEQVLGVALPRLRTAFFNAPATTQAMVLERLISRLAGSEPALVSAEGVAAELFSAATGFHDAKRGLAFTQGLPPSAATSAALLVRSEKLSASEAKWNELRDKAVSAIDDSGLMETLLTRFASEFEGDDAPRNALVEKAAASRVLAVNAGAASQSKADMQRRAQKIVDRVPQDIAIETARIEELKRELAALG